MQQHHKTRHAVTDPERLCASLLTPVEKNEIVAQKQEGRTASSLAEQYGINESHVNGLMHKAGLYGNKAQPKKRRLGKQKAVALDSFDVKLAELTAARVKHQSLLLSIADSEKLVLTLTASLESLLEDQRRDLDFAITADPLHQMQLG